MKSISLRCTPWIIAGMLLFVALTGSAQTVYVTKTGKKYHSGGCPYLRQSKIATTLSKAQADGYSACSVCKPDGKTDNSSSSKLSVAVQCSGTTKAGNRCKRMTTNANGRCYQH